MYFLPAQFSVVLSSIHAARTNFVPAHIRGAIPPTFMSNSDSTLSHPNPPPPCTVHHTEIDVLPPHTIQCCPIVHKFSKDKLCPGIYHGHDSSHFHTLHIPQGSMYFLPTQFSVVLSSIHAANCQADRILEIRKIRQNSEVID